MLSGRNDFIVNLASKGYKVSIDFNSGVINLPRNNDKEVPSTTLFLKNIYLKYLMNIGFLVKIVST